MSISDSLQRRIDELHDLIESSEVELKKLRMVYTYFPDLQINVDRWKKRRYYSEKANSTATDVDIHRSCGCCNDAAIMVRPYVESYGYKIYSDPAAFYVGSDGSDGCQFDENWEQALKDKNVSEAVVEKIRAYEEKNRRQDDSAEDDDYND